MNTWKTKRAILFGLDYPNTSNSLRGCVEDVKAVKQFLVDRCNFAEADVHLYADTDSALASTYTRSGIKQKLQQLASESHTCQLDGVYIHYSGHGSQTADEDCSEVDLEDEAIFCTDSRLLTDDVVGDILRQFNPVTTVVLCFDSCHSGSMCDVVYKYDTNVTCETTHQLSCACCVLSISGCHDEETSAESFDSGKWRGVMTCAFLKALDVPVGAEMSWLQLLDKMSKFLKASHFTQQPQLCTSFVLKNSDVVLAKNAVSASTPVQTAVMTYPINTRLYSVMGEASRTKAFLSVGGCNKPPLVFLENNTSVAQKFSFCLVINKKDIFSIQSQARTKCAGYLGCKSYSVLMLAAKNTDTQWQAIPLSNGGDARYRFKNIANGLYLSVSFGTVCTSRNSGATEIFQLGVPN